MAENFQQCLDKQAQIQRDFSHCMDAEEMHLKIIERGRSLPLLAKEERVEKYRIAGCQSLLYLKTSLRSEKLAFSAYSNALISLGLAAVLIEIYQDELPEVVLRCPPKVLAKIGVTSSLTPGRMQGVNSLYARMRLEAALLS